MKTVYVSDFQNQIPIGASVNVFGWVKGRRKHRNVIFLDICDSTGSIQVVFDLSRASREEFELARTLQIESSVNVTGLIAERLTASGPVREILGDNLELIGRATKQLFPNAHKSIDIFDSKTADHFLRNRHLYIRNEKIMAILRFRDFLMGFVRGWFRDNGFVEITAPVLTALPLYDDGTALSVMVEGEKVFLTQCVGFYLESAVHAFEKVYNIGPSFRGEESRSKRHLMEYWHIKGEIAFGNLDDIISIVEDLINSTVKACEAHCSDLAKTISTEICTDGLSIPFPRVSYREAIDRLKDRHFKIEFGTSLGSEEEAALSADFHSPFWVTGIPRRIEPFPYVIDPEDPEVTRTADLIATRGYGELLGVAEKIDNSEMLNERLMEKGKDKNPQYEWLRELREYGSVPHIGFGMGVERLIRWLLGIPHVRDAIPFPRSFRRRIYP